MTARTDRPVPVEATPWTSANRSDLVRPGARGWDPSKALGAARGGRPARTPRVRLQPPWLRVANRVSIPALARGRRHRDPGRSLATPFRRPPRRHRPRQAHRARGQHPGGRSVEHRRGRDQNRGLRANRGCLDLLRRSARSARRTARQAGSVNRALARSVGLFARGCQQTSGCNWSHPEWWRPDAPSLRPPGATAPPPHGPVGSSGLPSSGADTLQHRRRQGVAWRRLPSHRPGGFPLHRDAGHLRRRPILPSRFGKEGPRGRVFSSGQCGARLRLGALASPPLIGGVLEACASGAA